MTLDDFASFQRLMGIKVRAVDGHYWTQVRPGLYRPLLIWEALPNGPRQLPPLAAFGAHQYSVPSGVTSNSFLNWFIYDQVQSYTPADLTKNPRRQLRIGQANFEIRQMCDAAAFAAEAWPVYQSFHHRTHYRTGSHRREHRAFQRWASGLFQIPGLLILGGYHDGTLGGISLSLQLRDTIYYASVFCDDQSLRLSLYDLFWHTLRESAAAKQDVTRLFMGMYVHNAGLDNFKLLRGAKLVRQPAWLEINPVARLILKSVLPEKYQRLVGEISLELQPKKPATSEGPQALTS